MLPTVLVAGTAMAGYVLCWFLGIERIGAAVPTLIALCLPPVIVTVIALLRGQERLDANLVIVLGTALIGTAFIVLRDDAGSIGKGQMFVGVLFSFVSACLYAAFTLVNGALSTALGAGPATTCLTVVAALVMGLCAFFVPLNWPTGVPPQAWFLYLGVVTAALALLAFNWGAAKLSPTALTVATLVEPLTVVLLAALFFGEQLEPRQWLGGALLLASIGGLGLRLAND